MNIFVKAKIKIPNSRYNEFGFSSNQKGKPITALLLLELISKNDQLVWVYRSMLHNCFNSFDSKVTLPHLPTLTIKYHKFFQKKRDDFAEKAGLIFGSDGDILKTNIVRFPLLHRNETILPFDERQLKYIKMSDNQSFYYDGKS